MPESGLHCHDMYYIDPMVNTKRFLNFEGFGNVSNEKQTNAAQLSSVCKMKGTQSQARPQLPLSCCLYMSRKSQEPSVN